MNSLQMRQQLILPQEASHSTATACVMTEESCCRAMRCRMAAHIRMTAIGLETSWMDAREARCISSGAGGLLGRSSSSLVVRAILDGIKTSRRICYTEASG